MNGIARKTAALMTALLVIAAGTARAAEKAEKAEKADESSERATHAAEVYTELIKAPDKGVPKELLENCKCVAVFPHVLKAAVGVGARHGRGVVSCRNASGQWSPIAFMRITGGSWGLQLGAESTDLVLFFMTDRSAQSLLDSKFTLGAKAGVAAGPVGRSAEAATDVKLNAEIYSYARSKGLFAGLSLEGANLAPDKESIQKFYGSPVDAKTILFDQQVPRRPPAGDAFVEVLK